MLLALFVSMFSIYMQPAWAESKFLLIGDSHSLGKFGEAMESGRLHVQRYAVSGSKASDWAKEKMCPSESECALHVGYRTPEKEFPGTPPPTYPSLATLLKKYPRHTLVIALGTNDAAQNCREHQDEAVEGVEALIKMVKKRKCFWVGAPRYIKGPIFEGCGGNYEQVVEKIKKKIADTCTYIDSREIENKKSKVHLDVDLPDGIHFGYRMSLLWATSVADQILK